MALTRRQSLIDRTVNRRDAKLFIIATEGVVTEPAYFEAFNPVVIPREPFTPSPISVKVLPPVQNLSAPHHVLKQLKEFVQGIMLDPRDEVWMVLDVDTWDARTLAEVCAAAQRSKFQVAISNPCFEIWLCLHFASCSDNEITQNLGERSTGAKLKRLWRQKLPSNSIDIERRLLRPQAHIACGRARGYDQGDLSPQHPWPAAPATRVYLLVERLLEMLEG